MEKPILFRGDTVKAILDGRKTQTRRVIKPQPIPFGTISYGGTRQGWLWKPESLNRSWSDDDKDPYRLVDLATSALGLECPYGKPGDELWVRETWRTGEALNSLPPKLSGPKSPFQYRVDMSSIKGRDVTKYSPWGKWRASIHMPRWASRIQLRVKDVRVERIQDISERDAKAEGDKNPFEGHFHKDGTPIKSSACLRFKTLWDSINAKRGYGWDTNPWVWVIEFEIIAEHGEQK